MALLDTLRRTLDRSDLLRPGQSVMAAVSGGPDSLSLLHALHTLQTERQIPTLSAAHLDHGLRGPESAAEASFVAAFCAERGIPCLTETLGSEALTQKSQASLQAAARAARYDFLQRAAARLGADKIATAHTQDDQVETVLMNILRGSGLEGLRGVPYTRDNIIRPLRDTMRQEVEAYCAEQNLDPRRDPSNSDASHYLRNRVRLELLPELESRYAPGVREALIRLSRSAALDDAYLQSQTEEALGAVQISASSQSILFDRAKLASLPPALQRRTLRMALTRLRGSSQDIEEHHIGNFLAAVQNSDLHSYSITIPHPHCQMLLRENAIALNILSVTPVITIMRTALSPSRTAYFGVPPWTIEAHWASETGGAEYVEILDADQIDLPSLHVRGWRAGDRMDLLGLGGRSKKLSDVFTDAKTPREQRASIPIIADANGPLWVVGLRIAERARTTAATIRFLRLSARPPAPTPEQG